MNALTKRIMPAPRVADLDAYDSDWTLIPLHKPGAESVRKGKAIKDGKRPLDSNWTKRKYLDNDSVVMEFGGSHNIGVRLRKDQLIVDVDPRNGGMESLKKLKRLTRTDFKQFPRVITGSGGFHFYMAKPKDLKIVGSLPELPGIDFKSHGGQVVAAGSVHPGTGTHYSWDKSRPSLSGMTMAPTTLLESIVRKPVEHNDEAQPATPEELAGMLAVLDVEDYRDEKTWRDFMMACHHATSGDGREEFIEWSTQDPEYADDRGIIGRRWDSCSHDRPDGITARTLYKAVSDAGHPELCPQADPNATAKAAFEGVVEDDDADDDAPPLSRLERMSCVYHGVLDGGRYRVMMQLADPDRHGQVIWQSMPKNDFCALLANKPKLERGEGKKKKKIPIADAWLNWPHRENAVGTTIAPDQPTGALVGGHSDYAGALNLWTGWGVKPVEGDWSKFREMIHTVLCNEDEESTEYLLNLIAWKIQNPGLPIEVSTVFKGEKGCGKTTLGSVMVSIFGSHGIVVSTQEQLAGKFSGHLKQICFIFADEAFESGGKADTGTLKKLITDKDITRESKGLDAVRAINRAGLFIAGNNGWTVPATMDERRFFVLNPSTTRIVPRGAPADHPNRLYWNAVYDELDNGGRSAFLYAMLNHKLPRNWHPRNEVPQTQALADEIVAGLTGIDKWWHRILQDEELPVEDVRDGELDKPREWSEGAMRVSPAKLTVSYRKWLDENRSGLNCSARMLLRELKKYGVSKSSTHSPRYWHIPKLATARAVAKQKVHGDGT